MQNIVYLFVIKAKLGSNVNIAYIFLLVNLD